MQINIGWLIIMFLMWLALVMAVNPIGIGAGLIMASLATGACVLVGYLLR